MTSTVPNLLPILLALGVPGLIGLYAPKPWRLALLILWMLGPALMVLALGGIEAVRDPAPIDWGKLLHGLALILSVLALPWLLACLAGFAVGSVLRTRRRATTPPMAVAAAATPIPPSPARDAVVANGHLARRIAPDGSIMVELEATEWFNGGWVNGPCVTDLRTGRTLLDLRGTDWDAVVDFPRGQAVRLGLTSHRHGTARALEMDLATGLYTIEGSTEGGPIAALPALFDAENLKAYADPRRFLPPGRPRATARSYGIALLILVPALLAIAGATYLTLRLSPAPPPHKLDRVPAMPQRLIGNTPAGVFPGPAPARTPTRPSIPGY